MRASDDLRERIVARLGAGYADGLLGFDTLCHRVDSAYTARSVEQLRGLVRDLPAPITLLQRLKDRVRPDVRLDGALEGRASLLCPPPEQPGACYVIGRDPGCDLSLAEPAVSRRHAALRRGHSGWTIADLGSTNGTFVNGWRVRGDARLEPGDALSLGDTAWVFAPRI